MSRSNPLSALVRFEMRSGGRVALRTVAPAAGLLAAAGVLAGDPLLPFAMTKALFFPPRLAVLPGVLAASVFAGLAVTAERRLAAGGAWLSHLPLSREHRLIGTAVGLWLSELPILILVLLGGVLAVSAGPAEPAAWRLVGLPLVAWVAAAAVARGARRAQRWILVLAVSVGGAGAWWGVVAAVGIAALVTWLPVRRRHESRTLRWERSWQMSLPVPRRAELWIRMSWRAAGRQLMGAALTPALAVLPAVLFVANNELAPRLELGALLFGGAVGMVLAVSSGAESLRRRRPPWPWARSLPWTVRDRVLMDAGMLLAASVPAAVIVACLNPGAAAFLGLAMPLLVVRGAAAVRATEQLQGGAVGSLLLEGLCGAALIALLPWSALACAASTVIALRCAVRTGRARPVARWQEMDHLDVGDPMSA